MCITSTFLFLFNNNYFLKIQKRYLVLPWFENQLFCSRYIDRFLLVELKSLSIKNNVWMSVWLKYIYCISQNVTKTQIYELLTHFTVVTLLWYILILQVYYTIMMLNILLVCLFTLRLIWISILCSASAE